MIMIAIRSRLLLKGVPGYHVTLVIKTARASMNFTLRERKLLVNPVPHFKWLHREDWIYCFQQI